MCLSSADDAGFVESDFREQPGLISVVDEMVGQAHSDETYRLANFIEDSGDFGTRAPDQHVLFDAYQQRMFPCQFCNQFAINRFDEAHVGHGGVKFFGGLQGRGQHAAVFER